MKSLSEALADRLKEWEEEKRTNKYGMAELADRAIVLIRQEQERRSADRKEHDEEGR